MRELCRLEKIAGSLGDDEKKWLAVAYIGLVRFDSVNYDQSAHPSGGFFGLKDEVVGKMTDQNSVAEYIGKCKAALYATEVKNLVEEVSTNDSLDNSNFFDRALAKSNLIFSRIGKLTPGERQSLIEHDDQRQAAGLERDRLRDEQTALLISLEQGTLPPVSQAVPVLTKQGFVPDAERNLKMELDRWITALSKAMPIDLDEVNRVLGGFPDIGLRIDKDQAYDTDQLLNMLNQILTDLVQHIDGQMSSIYDKHAPVRHLMDADEARRRLAALGPGPRPKEEMEGLKGPEDDAALDLPADAGARTGAPVTIHLTESKHPG